MATLGDLAGALVHWMNNAVGIIRIHAQEISCNTQNDETTRSYANEIFSISEKFLKETGNLQNWINEKPCLVNIIKSIQLAFDQVHIPNNIKLDFSFDDNILNVLGGKKQIRDVLVNLIQNSIDAMPDGGLLSISAKKYSWQNRYFVQIGIGDSGIGINETDKKHIFERNFSTKNTGKRLGFGLWWAKLYIERLEGSIDFTSEIGKGTTFKITLLGADTDQENF